MAIMVPRHPKEFNKWSKEDTVFNQLKRLPSQYWVFHSVSLLNIKDGASIERQIDFIIFHPDKGMICLEAKNWGTIEYRPYRDPDTKYGWFMNGSPVKNPNYDGPISQANSYKSKLIEKLKKHNLQSVREAVGHCKILSAVWFLAQYRNQIDNMTLPLNANRDAILSIEELTDVDLLTKRLDVIFDQSIQNINPVYFKPLNHDESNALVNALAPEMILPFDTFQANYNELAFVQLLKQQYNVLNFLEEQDSAVISGTAGTGKTMLAIEKSRRHALLGESVLYLCFNSDLRDYLHNRFKNENIHYKTLYEYFGNIIHHTFDENNEEAFLDETLRNLSPDNYGGYQHIILDEGQDIRKHKKIEDLLLTLKDIIEQKSEENIEKRYTFYVFYDKMQLLPYLNRDFDGKMPKIISDADCKLSLFINCRNTIRIAQSSMVTVTPKPPKSLEEITPVGTVPSIYYCYNRQMIPHYVSTLINKIKSDGIDYKDIVVLSLKGMNARTPLQMPHGISYSTVGKFKGLEARAIILVDFDKSAFDSNDDEAATKYYVASSRARDYLYIVSSMTNQDARDINPKIFKWSIDNYSIPEQFDDLEDLELALGISRASINQPPSRS